MFIFFKRSIDDTALKIQPMSILAHKNYDDELFSGILDLLQSHQHII